MESTRFDGRSIKVKAAIVGTFDAIVVPKFFDIYPIEIDWFIIWIVSPKNLFEKLHDKSQFTEKVRLELSF